MAASKKYGSGNPAPESTPFDDDSDETIVSDGAIPVVEVGGTEVTGPEAFTSPSDVLGAKEVDSLQAISLSYPPYWNPSPGDDMAKAQYMALVKEGRGRWFKAIPLYLDARDPKMPRWVLQASHDLRCYKGGKEDRKAVTVKAGEMFSMSDYKLMQMDQFIGYEILAQVTGQVKTKQPQPAWLFSVKVTPDVKRLRDEELKRLAKAHIEAYRNKRDGVLSGTLEPKQIAAAATS